MLKQSLLYLFLSILVVIGSYLVTLVVVYIHVIYAWIYVLTQSVFSKTSVGITIHKTLLLVLLPLLVTAIPAGIYRVIKGKNLPCFFELTWFVWLIIVLCVVLAH